MPACGGADPSPCLIGGPGTGLVPGPSVPWEIKKTGLTRLRSPPASGPLRVTAGQGAFLWDSPDTKTPQAVSLNHRGFRFRPGLSNQKIRAKGQNYHHFRDLFSCTILMKYFPETGTICRKCRTIEGEHVAIISRHTFRL